MNTDFRIDIKHEVDLPSDTPMFSQRLIISAGLCVLCMLFSFALLIFSTPRAMAADAVVVLKSDVYLSDNVVTVGDVFENAGEHANHVLAPAPDAGDTLVLGYNDLKRIAGAFNYTWQGSAADNIVLQRAVSEVDKSDIARLVEDAVRQDLGNADRVEIAMDTVLPRVIMNGLDDPALEVTSVKTDTIDGSFDVTVAASNENGARKTVDMSGRFYRVTDIPVLASNIQRGDVIRERDIKMTSVRQDQITQDIVLSRDDLIGMAPRRTLTTDRPVRLTDLERPQIVKKGETITMVLKNGPMTLTAKGKALDNGSMGDTIRVLNESSKRTVDAQVTGTQRAEIELDVNRI
tara:strand:- start:38 stop:1081 length:1044 start_codon:yes stop_codon:yes gene_type:complete